ncbi:MAG: RluA family pseudouridine synthase [Bacteroides sp.]|nr:RluA family pseudouridine synthase [Bacteroides sp.]MCM1413220.1 RluA family pseudouridine synthase [Bacteroides sp.]MCM1471470.1 RluA family pseudouridine synthase [Bacteroides sp.]
MTQPDQHNAPQKEKETRSRFKPDVIKTLNVAEPATLLQFVMDALPEMKRTRIKQMLSHNQIAVNGEPTSQFDMELNAGDQVKVNFVREFRVFRHRRLKIVYEDDDIIVVEKGYGLLSMGNDREKDSTAYAILRDYVKWSNPANKIFIVHRLDRDTSGLMMFAKNEEAKRALQHNWNNMVLNRKYLAVVEGAPEAESGTIRSYLVENSKYEVYSTDDPEQGQLAVTRYKTLSSNGRFSLLEVELDTGRKNQIRVHMKDLGHPISGDRKYGANSSPLRRLCLHAQTLRFIHPTTHKEMNFSTPVPKSFASLAR